MSADAPRVSVVIPVYNEAALVGPAVDELHDALDALGWDHEILLAENGSTDGTRERLAELAARRPRVRWVSEPTPNYGRALRRGILEARGALVLCDEIDLCDVDFHRRAVARLEADEADLVVGSKTVAGARDRRPLLRRAATRAINGLLRLSLDFRGTDTHGLKAFRRDRMLAVVRACVVDRDLFASELVIRAWRAGKRVIELPVRVEEKRQPSIRLGRRVPGVLKNLATLVWVIRVRGR